jgi:2,3-bisphosphoglycerate-independent phosphoglycerate mutase
MRCILVILDGLGDRSYEVLGGRTPLQAAQTPNLDRLAAMGMNGLYHAAWQGLALPSEEAHFLLFGYERSEFPGRGILEAIGYGIPVSDEDVAVLAHFCEVREEGDQLILVRERADVDESVLPPLQRDICEFESGGIRIAFAPTKKIEGLLLLSGPVSPFFTDSDPMYEGFPLIAVDPLDGRSKSQASARAVSEYLRWAYGRLACHPVNQDRGGRGLPLANAVVTQRPGKKRHLPSFDAKWGLPALSISSGPVYWGLCEQTGIAVERVKDTDDPEADLRERLAIARDRNDMEFIHVHTKGPDEAAHTKDPHRKRDLIEALDRAMAAALDDLAADPEIVLVITADHSTPCSEPLIHSGETVPVTILGKNIRRDTVESFDEIACARGALGPVRGRELMYVILNLLDRAKLVGLMDTPADQPYYPGKRRPLRLGGD